MKPSVRIRLGDLFDGPADLIVIPSSTAGSVTSFVARALSKHGIALPVSEMRLGQVTIQPFEGATNIAQYVAIAASVHYVSSSLEAIEEIGRTIGSFTMQNPSVRTVSAPLLGAGAGNLQSEMVVAALRSGFLSTAAHDASLVIHILHPNVFERIAGDIKGNQTRPLRPVRVFISHTSNSDETVSWVTTLAKLLIENGIQARLDRFHLRRGMDLPQWMCNELAMADKVVIICDETYKQKADGRLGGVGWETMIIQGDLANLEPNSTKYQVIVRADSLADGLPMYLKTKYAFHSPGPTMSKKFQSELIQELLDMPNITEQSGREIAL